MNVLLNIFKAGKGDSFLLSWNDKNMLIDSGVPLTCQLRLNPKFPSLREIDFFVLTHIDYDHIAGMIKLLRSASQKDVNSDAIFYANTIDLIKYKDDDSVGFHHGGEFSELLLKLGITNKPLVSGDTIELHGLKATILSPTLDILQTLKLNWAEAIEKESTDPHSEGFVSVKNKEFSVELDSHVPESEKSIENDILNASSIAMLIEHESKSLLMLGDAHSIVVSETIRSLLSQDGKDKLDVDVIKVSHHGSKHNTSYEFLNLVNCNRFIISTNGAGPYYHPDSDTIIKLVQCVKDNGFQHVIFYFNYSIPSEFDIINEQDLGIEIQRVITSEVVI